jgi:hypothetical protein
VHLLCDRARTAHESSLFFSLFITVACIPWIVIQSISDRYTSLYDQNRTGPGSVLLWCSVLPSSTACSMGCCQTGARGDGSCHFGCLHMSPSADCSSRPHVGCYAAAASACSHRSWTLPIQQHSSWTVGPSAARIACLSLSIASITHCIVNNRCMCDCPRCAA